MRTALVIRMQSFVGSSRNKTKKLYIYIIIIIYIYYYNYIYIIKQDRSKTKISGGTNALIFHNFGLKLGFCSVVLIVIPKTGKENAPECL